MWPRLRAAWGRPRCWPPIFVGAASPTHPSSAHRASLSWRRGRFQTGLLRLRRLPVRAEPLRRTTSNHPAPPSQSCVGVSDPPGSPPARLPRTSAEPPTQPTVHSLPPGSAPLHPLQGERQIRASSAEIGEGSAGLPSDQSHPFMVSRPKVFEGPCRTTPPAPTPPAR